MVGMDVKRPNPFDMDDMWEVRMYAVKLQHENDFLRRALARSETVVYARKSGRATSSMQPSIGLSSSKPSVTPFASRTTDWLNALPR